MKEAEFREWLKESGKKSKIISDTLSRLRRVEREIGDCDIDAHYEKDKCEYLMSLFLKMGKNDEMKKYPNVSLPIGKYYMGTYRLALKQYVAFRDSEE